MMIAVYMHVCSVYVVFFTNNLANSVSGGVGDIHVCSLKICMLMVESSILEPSALFLASAFDAHTLLKYTCSTLESCWQNWWSPFAG